MAEKLPTLEQPTPRRLTLKAIVLPGPADLENTYFFVITLHFVYFAVVVYIISLNELLAQTGWHSCLHIILHGDHKLCVCTYRGRLYKIMLAI